VPERNCKHRVKHGAKVSEEGALSVE